MNLFFSEHHWSDVSVVLILYLWCSFRRFVAVIRGREQPWQSDLRPDSDDQSYALGFWKGQVLPGTRAIERFEFAGKLGLLLEPKPLGCHFDRKLALKDIRGGKEANGVIYLLRRGLKKALRAPRQVTARNRRLRRQIAAGIAACGRMRFPYVGVMKVELGHFQGSNRSTGGGTSMGQSVKVLMRFFWGSAIAMHPDPGRGPNFDRTLLRDSLLGLFRGEFSDGDYM